MGFFTALSFLTVIPPPLKDRGGPDGIGRSLSFFPVVGLLIGLILAVLNWLLGMVLPDAVVYGLVLAALAVVTGGLHLDGFADTCDGIAGHKTVEERLRIMRDSRVGAFGVIGVVLLLLIQYVSLLSLPDNLAAMTLVLMPVVSRWAMVYAVAAYPNARPEGLGQAFKQGANRPGFAVATMITLVITLGLTRWANIVWFYLASAAIILTVWIVALGLASWLKGKLGGLSGDTYGAISEVAEVTVLITVLSLAQNQWFGVSV